MENASLHFIGYALLIALIYNLSRAVAWRQIVLLAASLGFLAFFSLDPIAFLPLAGFLCLGFLGVLAMQSGRLYAFVPLLCLCIASFVWLKKYAFLPSNLFIGHPYITLGLSYIFFRVLHLIIDSHSKELPRIGLCSYLNYTLNFATLVSGPIQWYEEFAGMHLATAQLPINAVVVAEAVRRIIVGFFKVNVLSLLFATMRADALNRLASPYSASGHIVDGILIVSLYPIFLYCNFSGYIDIVIGIGRLMRIQFPENFNRPFSSTNFLIFWSRWHITLSTWLRTYVYNSLLLSLRRRWPSRSRAPLFDVLALFVTFFLIGVWHGQTSSFMFYGALQGIGVGAVRIYQIVMASRVGRSNFNRVSAHWLYRDVARGLTYTWYAFTMLWFWSNWVQIDSIWRLFSIGEIALVWTSILLIATVVLGSWEVCREWVLSFRYAGEPVILSRYVKTAWATALTLIGVGVTVLLNAPAPDIVYKAF